MSSCHIKFIILWHVVHGGVHTNVETILIFLYKASFIVTKHECEMKHFVSKSINFLGWGAASLCNWSPPCQGNLAVSP